MVLLLVNINGVKIKKGDKMPKRFDVKNVRGDRKVFSKTAKGKHKKNGYKNLRRGGYRL